MPIDSRTRLTAVTYDEYFSQIRQMQTGQTSNGISPGYGLAIGSSAIWQPTSLTLRQKRKAEKDCLKEFISTGSPSGLKMMGNGDDGLVVVSHTINGQATLFTLDRQEIVALKGRTKHLEGLLTELADRENLQLTYVEEALALQGDNHPTVYFWVFDNLVVDDSALMVARPAPRPPRRPEREATGCGIPDCVECFNDNYTDERAEDDFA